MDTNQPSGTLNLAAPTALSGLSFLTTAGNGSPTIDYVVRHANGSSETGTFVSPDWFANENYAMIPNGRVNVGSGGFQSVDAGNPKLFSVDIALLNTTSPVTSIEFGGTQAGNAHAAVFAVSGAATPGGAFAPLAVTGFNHDVVVESDAYHPPANINGTTATMDSGLENIAATYYERGYNTATNALETGLPTAGSFGADGDQAAPFVGPVGLVITPSLGAEGSGTIVNAVRFYTANDAVDRDPLSFHARRVQ